MIDLDAIRGAGIRMGVDPLGGAGVHYWARIAERYELDLTVVSEEVDPTFRFMTLDWDGRHSHGSVVRLRDAASDRPARIATISPFACDTDHDRHGIVTRSAGLLPSNHYLAVAIDYLFQNRPQLEPDGRGGQDRGQQRDDRPRDRTGWVASSTRFRSASNGSSTACSTARSVSAAKKAPARPSCAVDGTVWTTDKDGIVPALLVGGNHRAHAAAIRASCIASSTRELGEPVADRVEAPATPEQKQKLAKLSPQQVTDHRAGRRTDR